MLILFKALIVFVFSKIHYPRKKHKIAISAPKSSNFLTLSYIIIFGHQQENYYHGVKKKYHDMIIYYHAVIKDFPGLRVLFEYKLSELVEAAAPCVPFVGSALRNVTYSLYSHTVKGFGCLHYSGVLLAA